jgi:hypothetical protein
MHEEIAVKRCLDVNGRLRSVAAPPPPKCSPAPARNSHASGAQRKCTRPNADGAADTAWSDVINFGRN